MKGFAMRYLVAGLGCFLAIGSGILVRERAGSGWVWRNSHSEEVHRIYPYSVIPGGVRSAWDLQRALERDSAAREHYKGFAVERVRQQVLREDKKVFVSYRIANRVFWTRKRILLKKGEAILTDGVWLARVRCGNRISEEQREEVSLLEPDQRTLDTWFDDQPGTSAWKSLQPDAGTPPLQRAEFGATAGFRPELQPATVSGQMSGGERWSGGGGGAGGNPGSGRVTGATTGGTSSGPGSFIVSGEFQAGKIETGLMPATGWTLWTGTEYFGPFFVVGPSPGPLNAVPAAGFLPGLGQGGSLAGVSQGPLLPGAASSITGAAGSFNGAALPTPVGADKKNAFLIPGSVGGSPGGGSLGKDVQAPEPSTTALAGLGAFGLLAGILLKRFAAGG